MALDINFYCRKSKADRKGEASIEMSLIINGERTYIKLQRKANPDEFKKAMASKKVHPIKQFCDTARARVNDLITDMMNARIELTAKSLKECYQNGGVVKSKNINDIFTNYLELKSSEVGSGITQDTFNRYKKSAQLFYEYNPDLSPDTLANKVEPIHLERMQIGTLKIYDASTACNYLQKIKAIWTDAFEMGYIPSNPAWKLKIDKGVKDKILYLTQEELAKIKNHSYVDRLQRVADIFLFQCYTGLAYGDIELLTPEDFQTREATGQIYIEKQRIKTGVWFCAVLLKDAKDIARKYNFQLPIISNQKCNAYLKEIGDIAGIDKPLTTHMARHSACAYLLNYRPAIPNETIIKIMGWTSEKQLRHYARIFKETVLDDVKAISDRVKDPNMKTIKTKSI